MLAAEPVVSAPVPVERMVGARAIAIRRGIIDDGTSGLLVSQGDVATIGVNASQGALRRLFAVAREFGHLMPHEGMSEHVDSGQRADSRDRQSSLARDAEEIEANLSAATLLMPSRLLDEAGAANAADDGMVQALAKAGQVSRHAMSLRLANVCRRRVPS